MLRRFSLMSASLSFFLCVGVLLTTLPLARQQQLTPAEPFGGLSASGRTGSERFASASYSAAPLDSLTLGDLNAAAAKWNQASPALDEYWRTSFAVAGRRYATPRIVSMNSNVVQTGCGVVERNGPFYCTVDHTIYSLGV